MTAQREDKLSYISDFPCRTQGTEAAPRERRWWHRNGRWPAQGEAGSTIAR